MADISVSCKHCGKAHKISEYIDAKTIPCLSCGKEIELPVREKSAGIRLRKTEVPVFTPAPDPAAVMAAANDPAALEEAASRRTVTAKIDRKEKKQVGRSLVMIVASWILFLGLATGLYYLRYHSEYAGLHLAQLQEYGLITVAACYVGIFLLSLKDNMFDALMCVVIPFYPVYYIFFSSSVVLARAVVAAVLVGFGQDTVMFLQVQSTNFINFVNHWIQTV